MCCDIPLIKGSVAGLPLICTEGGAPGYKSTGRSRIHDRIAIQSIQTSCPSALPVNLDIMACSYGYLWDVDLE
jgi:hypothetical protein